MTLFIGNYSGHKHTGGLEDKVTKSKTKIRYSSPHTTDHIQVCDSFAMQKLNYGFLLNWEAFMLKKS